MQAAAEEAPAGLLDLLCGSGGEPGLLPDLVHCCKLVLPLASHEAISGQLLEVRSRAFARLAPWAGGAGSHASHAACTSAAGCALGTAMPAWWGACSMACTAG